MTRPYLGFCSRSPATPLLGLRPRLRGVKTRNPSPGLPHPPLSRREKGGALPPEAARVPRPSAGRDALALTPASSRAPARAAWASDSSSSITVTHPSLSFCFGLPLARPCGAVRVRLRRVRPMSGCTRRRYVLSRPSAFSSPLAGRRVTQWRSRSHPAGRPQQRLGVGFIQLEDTIVRNDELNAGHHVDMRAAFRRLHPHPL